VQTSPEIFVQKLIDAEFAIDSWNVLGAGQNSIAILANEEWVFRFPLHASAAESFQSELAVLKTVHGRLPVLTPNPEIVAEVEGLEWPVVGYRLIGGQVMGREQIDSFDSETMNHLGRTLGRFLTTLHATPASRFKESELRHCDNQEQWSKLTDEVRSFLKPRVESTVWNRIRRKLSKSVDKINRLEFEPVLRHGDFGAGNFLFDHQNRLSGVIDFGSAGFGDPAVDVAGLMASTGPGEALVKRVLPVYPAIEDMIGRARIYRETFALEEALLGAKSDDEISVKSGLDSYLDY